MQNKFLPYLLLIFVSLFLFFHFTHKIDFLEHQLREEMDNNTVGIYNNIESNTNFINKIIKTL